MNLHDPSRPKILHRPAFSSGWQVIPRLQLWPLENGQVELSLMLPVKDERFAGKWYNIMVDPKDLPMLLSRFQEDPEGFVCVYFGLDIFHLKSIPKGDPHQVDGESVMDLLK
jgi:hypothetical protein